MRISDSGSFSQTRIADFSIPLLPALLALPLKAGQQASELAAVVAAAAAHIKILKNIYITPLLPIARFALRFPASPKLISEPQFISLYLALVLSQRL